MERKFNLQSARQAGFIGFLIGLVVAIGAAAITYVVITKPSTNFLNKFLSIVSRQEPTSSVEQPFPQFSPSVQKISPPSGPTDDLQPSTDKLPSWIPLYPTTSLVYGGAPPPTYSREGELLPMPPGAEMEIWVYKISSGNVASTVADFYRKELLAQEWTIMQAEPEEDGGAQFTAQKGLKSLIIGISYSVPADFTHEVMTNVAIVFPKNIRQLP